MSALKSIGLDIFTEADDYCSAPRYLENIHEEGRK
jgi:hypothetical protein